MGRTAVRTRELLRDTVEQMLNLFGTIKNAHRRLGLDGVVAYHNFNRALQHYTVSQEDKDKIDEAWDRWKELFLVRSIPKSSDFTLSPELINELPAWHPDAPLDDEHAENRARFGKGTWSSSGKTKATSSSGSSSARPSTKTRAVGNGEVAQTAKATAP